MEGVGWLWHFVSRVIDLCNDGVHKGSQRSLSTNSRNLWKLCAQWKVLRGSVSPFTHKLTKEVGSSHVAI